ncbi:MAG TPA: exodeoxyribonuclease VII large subunit [Symbiobacteriaceae bacterium]|nr:exodeoxyribonuclease VII large subunit [Symbiobacteriaceae bacterium]
MFDRGSSVTVRELTMYIKRLLENDSRLASVWVRGEISNFKWHTSGHLYFTLKDETTAIKCVMFRSAAQRLRFKPDNGMQVLLFGNVTVYERDGAYQLYAQEMEPAGVGALHLQYEQLKRKLEAEGLFDPALKRRLPMLPRRVGIVTATTGAAVRDMISICRRRFPGVRLLISPALVQGAEAPASLIRALGLVAQEPEVDVVIIGRGGGSLEDLWAFNDEALARAIRACPVPVVSAVGHETDFTIADFAADLRAPTPSAAAELVVPSRLDLQSTIDSLKLRLVSLTRRVIERKRYRLRALAERPVLQRPQGRLLQDRQRLDDLVRRLGFAGGRRIERSRQRLGGLAGRLDALSPLAVLSRGYSITKNADGHVIRNTKETQVGETVSIMLHKGTLQARVESKTEEL